MIFIPSKGGRSHRVDEMSDWDAIERGANVLLRTLLASRELIVADRAVRAGVTALAMSRPWPVS